MADVAQQAGAVLGAAVTSGVQKAEQFGETVISKIASGVVTLWKDAEAIIDGDAAKVKAALPASALPNFDAVVSDIKQGASDTLSLTTTATVAAAPALAKGLEALADDVTDTVEALGIDRYVLVGHSMGGKVAQILAGRRPHGLAGLVLVAPAPPTPMRVPPEVRAGMLASYQSRAGVVEALQVLAGPALDDTYREQVVADTLRGEAGAKQSWPDEGMSADVSAALAGLDLPIEIVLAGHDRVEREAVLRPLFSRLLPRASVTTVPESGHLVPLEAPQAVATVCQRILARLADEVGSPTADLRSSP